MKRTNYYPSQSVDFAIKASVKIFWAPAGLGGYDNNPTPYCICFTRLHYLAQKRQKCLSKHNDMLPNGSNKNLKGDSSPYNLYFPLNILI